MVGQTPAISFVAAANVLLKRVSGPKQIIYTGCCRNEAPWECPTRFWTNNLRDFGRIVVSLDQKRLGYVVVRKAKN
jgi:hypothetical protein